MADQEPAVSGARLAESARTSLVWAGGFTLLRDVAQFATMLVLVRLLSPEDYGSMALAQSILALFAVASFGTFVTHAFQLRDPRKIDWQAHFTAAVVINTTLFFLTLLFAWALSFTVRFHQAALPLAGLSTMFLIEVPATLRHRMLETNHDWKRFRVLVSIGTILAMVVGLVVAFCGGGIWALVIQVPLFGVPAAVDLFWFARWRPNWSWSWARYRDSARFGANRIGAAAVLRMRQTVEQTWLAGVYDFGTLGVFTRSIGVATLAAGRIGAVATSSLYPIVTRADQRSDRFRRIAGIVLRGVCWTTIPVTALLAVCAEDVVLLLYGPKWFAVTPLLPLAAASVAVSGIATALSSLLLANNEATVSLVIDLVSAVIAMGMALWLIPIGVEIYLSGLVALGCVSLALTTGALVAKKGIDAREVLLAFLPPLLAAAGAAVLVAETRVLQLYGGGFMGRLFFEPLIFGVAYVAILRAVFPRSMRELLDVVPGRRHLVPLLYRGKADGL